MQEDRKQVLRGCFYAGLGGVIWGFSGTSGQYLFSHWPISSLWLTCMRMMGAGLIFLVLALIKNRREVVELLRSPRDLALTALYGIGGLLLCQYSYMTGISHSNAATTTVLQTLTIVMVMVIACCHERKLPRWHEVLSVALALLGVFLLATGGKPGQMVLSPKGLFWGLMTAAAMTLYTLLGRPLAKRWSRDTVMAVAMTMGGIVINLGARSWQFDVSLPARGWLLVAFIVVFGTVVTFALFLQGIRDAGPVRASILSVTEPVSAAILAFFWLGTQFTAADLLGFAAILATVFLLAKNE
ncbi:MAG: EamA family transporter [Oscillospiraceae bacterium]|nr:EamA family transporter [Oscillospiraceae bacterium]